MSLQGWIGGLAKSHLALFHPDSVRWKALVGLERGGLVFSLLCCAEERCVPACEDRIVEALVWGRSPAAKSSHPVKVPV